MKEIDLPPEAYQNRDAVREVITRDAQKDFADPNLSETYKDAVIEVAEQILKQLYPQEIKRG